MRPAKYFEGVVLEDASDLRLAVLGMRNYTCVDSCAQDDDAYATLQRSDEIASVPADMLESGGVSLNPHEVAKAAVGLRNNAYLYQPRMRINDKGEFYVPDDPQVFDCSAFITDMYYRRQARRLIRFCAESGSAMDAIVESSRHNIQ